jgi:hypothetical protein
MSGHQYTPAQVAWLRRARRRLTQPQLGARFRARFGVAVSDRALHQACLRRGITTGRTGCFGAGDAPWNRGLSVRVSQRTEFKPGSRPANIRRIGEYRRGAYGRWLLKVRESGVAGYSRHDWEFVTHLTYLDHYGPIPPGHVVMLLDGDEDACLDPDNLVCVSRGTLARANQDGYADLPKDRLLRRAALAAAALRQRAHDAARAAGMSLYARRRLFRECAHAD